MTDDGKKTVLFLGAGATRAQWEAEDPNIMQQRMEGAGNILPPPLDADFLSFAIERAANNMPYVRGYLQRLLGTDIVDAQKKGQVSLGMEWVFVTIFREAAREGGFLDSRIALHHLLAIYRKRIAMSTLPVFPSSRTDTPLPALIRASRLSAGSLAIITTNQDLVAENVLDPDLGAFGTCVCGSGPLYLRDVYFLTGSLHETKLSPKDVGHRTVFPPIGWSDVAILKIHGSLNWWYISESDFDPFDVKGCDHLELFMEKTVAERDVVRSSDPHPMRLFPFVVPPVQEKERYFLGEILKPIWAEARKRLKECERLVVFGYSFPPADPDARDLFESSLNPAVEEISVIDKCDTAAKRLICLRNESDAKDGDKVKWFESVPDYLARHDSEIGSDC